MQFPERFSALPESEFPRLRRPLDGRAPGEPGSGMAAGEPRHTRGAGADPARVAVLHPRSRRSSPAGLRAGFAEGDGAAAARRRWRTASVRAPQGACPGRRTAPGDTPRAGRIRAAPVVDIDEATRGPHAIRAVLDRPHSAERVH